MLNPITSSNSIVFDSSDEKSCTHSERLKGQEMEEIANRSLTSLGTFFSKEKGLERRVSYEVLDQVPQKQKDLDGILPSKNNDSVDFDGLQNLEEKKHYNDHYLDDLGDRKTFWSHLEDETKWLERIAYRIRFLTELKEEDFKEINKEIQNLVEDLKKDAELSSLDATSSRSLFYKNSKVIQKRKLPKEMEKRLLFLKKQESEFKPLAKLEIEVCFYACAFRHLLLQEDVLFKGDWKASQERFKRLASSLFPSEKISKNDFIILFRFYFFIEKIPNSVPHNMNFLLKLGYLLDNAKPQYKCDSSSSKTGMVGIIGTRKAFLTEMLKQSCLQEPLDFSLHKGQKEKKGQEPLIVLEPSFSGIGSHSLLFLADVVDHLDPSQQHPSPELLDSIRNEIEDRNRWNHKKRKVGVAELDSCPEVRANRALEVFDIKQMRDEVEKLKKCPPNVLASWSCFHQEICKKEPDFRLADRCQDLFVSYVDFLEKLESREELISRMHQLKDNLFKGLKKSSIEEFDAYYTSYKELTLLISSVESYSSDLNKMIE